MSFWSFLINILALIIGLINLILPDQRGYKLKKYRYGFRNYGCKF